MLELTNERPSDEVLMDLNVDAETYDKLLNYGMDKCPREEVDQFLINWAVVDILKSAIEEAKDGCQKEG